jgi:hypothetical protein
MCAEYDKVTKASADRPVDHARLTKLRGHFRFFVQQVSSILLSRNALRNTDELRYFLLTRWPTFAKVASSMELDNFSIFLRTALRQQRFLADVRDSPVVRMFSLMLAFSKVHSL